MERVRLTLERISALTCPAEKQQAFLWDSEAIGLAVRVTSSGAKSFIFESKLNRRTIRITLGDVRAWVLNSIWSGKGEAKREVQRGAREEASRLKTIVDQGKDPRQLASDEMAAEQGKRDEKAAAALAEAQAANRGQITVGKVWDAYIAARRAKWSKRHLLDHQKLTMSERSKGEDEKTKTLKAGVLHSLILLPLSELTAERVTEWLHVESKTRRTQAALAFRLLRAFLNWCNETPEYCGIASANACASKSVRESVPKASAKEDALQREQLRLWFEGVGRVANRKVAIYLQGMLITGARPNELAGLRWDDVDFQWGGLKIHDKVEGERTIPLTPYFASLLRGLKARNETPPAKFRLLHGRKIENDLERWKPSALVFSSDRSVSGQIENAGLIHRQMLASVGIPNVTLHGLRRSFGSLSEWCECPVGVVAQIQGHKPSATAEKHYRVRPLDLLRMWHTKIEGWILEQAGIEQPSNEAKSGLKIVA